MRTKREIRRNEQVCQLRTWKVRSKGWEKRCQDKHRCWFFKCTVHYYCREAIWGKDLKEDLKDLHNHAKSGTQFK